MPHQVTDLDLRLPVGCEFRPVSGNGRIEVQRAAIDDQQRSERGHGFCCRIDIEDRVLLPGPGLRLIRETTPKIDYRLAVQSGAARSPCVSTAQKIPGLPGFGPGPRGLNVRNATMGEFASMLQAQVFGGGPPGGAPPAPAADNADAPPDLFAAFQQQLGLKLQPAKAPVDVLVFDHVVQPSGN